MRLQYPTSHSVPTTFCHWRGLQDIDSSAIGNQDKHTQQKQGNHQISEKDKALTEKERLIEELKRRLEEK
jgi:hypothetical protein